MKEKRSWMGSKQQMINSERLLHKIEIYAYHNNIEIKTLSAAVWGELMNYSGIHKSVDVSDVDYLYKVKHVEDACIAKVVKAIKKAPHDSYKPRTRND